LDYPSAGSVFKRPPDDFAGRLIEEAGLKGYRIGGAMVSEKHAGFIINYDNASSKDIKDLIDFVKNTIKEKFSVTLDTEIVFV
jgi:UDP-N-acetylmuramate dehydrogenase